MKKKRIIAVAALLLFGSLFWYFCPRPAPPVHVVGDFSAEDIAAIKKVVRQERKKEILDCFSWNKVKDLPRAIRKYSTTEIVEIQRRDAVGVYATIGPRKRSPAPLQQESVWGYLVKKTNNVWQMDP
jgi:hypothetical protein